MNPKDEEALSVQASLAVQEPDEAEKPSRLASLPLLTKNRSQHRPSQTIPTQPTTIYARR